MGLNSSILGGQRVLEVAEELNASEEIFIQHFLTGGILFELCRILNLIQDICCDVLSQNTASVNDLAVKCNWAQSREKLGEFGADIERCQVGCGAPRQAEVAELRWACAGDQVGVQSS